VIFDTKSKRILLIHVLWYTQILVAKNSKKGWAFTILSMDGHSRLKRKKYIFILSLEIYNTIKMT
jgi:hypothetical protein